MEDIQLPAHDETTTDRSRRIFSAVDWNRGGFHTHSKTEQEAGDEKLDPGLSTSRPDWRQGTENSRNKDSASSTQQVIHWIGQPGTQTRTSDIRSTIEELVSGFTVSRTRSSTGCLTR